MADLPSIPSVPGNLDPQLSLVLQAIKQNLDYLQANPLGSATNAVDAAQLADAVANAVSGITSGTNGTNGTNGANGAPGDVYILDITGGRTSIIYAADGTTPLPTMTAFGCQLYKNGVDVTSGISSFNWYIPGGATSMLSGTGATSTFTPTVSSTFDQTKADNDVRLIVSYSGISIQANEPIAITKVGTTGAAGTNGTRTGILDVYKWSASAPVTFPSGSSTYTWATGQFTAPATLNGWSLTPPAPVSGQTLWIARTIYADTNTTATTAVTWTATTATSISSSGTDGSTGSTGSAGTNGTRTAFLEVYQWAASTPTTFPSGTSTYTWATGAFTSPATLNGWSLLPGAAVAGNTLYGCSVAYSDILTTSTSNVTWGTTTAYAVGSAGTNGKSYLLFITGGKTNHTFDETGANPLPVPSAFSAELYEDGVLKTPATYAWTATGMLSGTSATGTFTPTLASSYSSGSSDKVLLTCTYAGQTVKATQPVMIVKNALGTAADVTPTAADNLTVTSLVLHNFLQWTAPGTGTTDHYEIWRNSADNRATASIVGTTQYVVYDDYVPEGVSNTQYYWVKAISKGGSAGPFNLVSGVVSSSGTTAGVLGIGDSQVNSISAAKIVALKLSALSATLGTVTAGILASADGRFVVNLITGEIIIASSTASGGTWDSASPPNFTNGTWAGGDYVKITNGNAITYQWNGSGHVQAKSLQTIESGVASSGATVSLSNYYRTQPKIILSPKSIQNYTAANSAVNQTLQIDATSITGSGSSWSFVATANSVLAAGTTVVSPNATTGPSSSTPLQSATYTTPANTTSVLVNVNLTSFRGTGTAPNYYYRSVTYQVWGRVSGSGSYVQKATSTVALGATLGAVNSTLSATMGSAASYDFYVTAAYSDAGSTFTSGSGGWTEYPVTLNLAANTAIVQATINPATQQLPISFPAFTPQPGATVYEQTYTIHYGFYMEGASQPYGYDTAQLKSKNGVVLQQAIINYTQGVQNCTNDESYTVTEAVSSVVTNINALGITTWGAFNSAFMQVHATGTTLSVKQHIAITNSTTASNTLKLNSYTNTLSGATQIAAGTLNYLVIGTS